MIYPDIDRWLELVRWDDSLQRYVWLKDGHHATWRRKAGQPMGCPAKKGGKIIQIETDVRKYAMWRVREYQLSGVLPAVSGGGGEHDAKPEPEAEGDKEFMFICDVMIANGYRAQEILQNVAQFSPEWAEIKELSVMSSTDDVA